MILALYRVVRNSGDLHNLWKTEVGRETRLLYTKGKPVEQQHLTLGWMFTGEKLRKA